MLVLDHVQTPPRDLQQRREALKRANEIRIWRSHLKRRVHDLEVLFHELIVDPDPWLESMQVRHLLRQVPTFGVTRVTKMMRAVGISPTRSIGALTQRQRDDLLAIVMAQPSYQRLIASVE